MVAGSTRCLTKAVQLKDLKAIANAVDNLRIRGYTYNSCYTIAKNANPALTLEEWEDFMNEIDALGY